MDQLKSRYLGKKGIDEQSINRSMRNTAPTPLNQRFFSPHNQRLIMRGLIDGVKAQTGLTIGEQYYSELIKIMRFIYNELWHDDYQDIPKQVNELNRLAIKEAVKWTLPDLLLHQKFQSEVLKNPVNILPLPKLQSQTGLRLAGKGPADALGLPGPGNFRN